jgi:hypothetical protein
LPSRRGASAKSTGVRRSRSLLLGSPLQLTKRLLTPFPELLLEDAANRSGSRCRSGRVRGPDAAQGLQRLRPVSHILGINQNDLRPGHLSTSGRAWPTARLAAKPSTVTTMRKGVSRGITLGSLTTLDVSDISAVMTVHANRRLAGAVESQHWSG